jgi:pimeloyl-ACP methyl ester carboxylesterase
MATQDRTDSVDLGGRRLAYRTLGDRRTPLLLVNGYAGSKADWDPTFLDRLTDTFTVIAPDNRGIGGSELGDPAELTIDSMANDLATLLDRLNIDRLPVVGWSMGGFIAQALARQHPERISALILLATDAGGPLATLTDAEVWAALTDHSGSARQQASRVLGVLFPAPLAEQIDRDFGDVVAAACAELRAETLTAQEAAIDAWHATGPPAPSDHSGLPVLIAAGTEDVVIPPENADQVARLWRQSRTETFPGGGHAFMAQEPEKLAATIGEFAAP